MAFNIRNRNQLSLAHHTRREIRYLQDLDPIAKGFFPPLLRAWGEDDPASVDIGYEIPFNRLRRIQSGITMGLLGAALMGWALFGDPGTAGPLVGLFGGAIVIFVGITIASPTFSSPVLRTIGAPLRFVPWLKVSGRLARENSARSVRTTSAAAASLMTPPPRAPSTARLPAR